MVNDELRKIRLNCTKTPFKQQTSDVALQNISFDPKIWENFDITEFQSVFNQFAHFIWFIRIGILCRGRGPSGFSMAISL